MVLTNLYDAIVDPSGLYDFVLPSLAIAAGAKRIFCRPGSYAEGKDLNLPANTVLHGAQQETVVIDFGGTSSSVICNSGYGTAQTAGTIAVTQGSNAVVGTGTAFLSLAPGDWITILNNTYAIASIPTNTSLTLVQTWRGQTRSGLNYKALAMFSGLTISDLTIRNSTDVGLNIAGVRRARVSNVAVRNCAGNINMTDCSESILKSISCSFSSTSGMTLTSVLTSS